MARLAILSDDETLAANVIEGDPADFPDAIDVTGTSVSKNWQYDSANDTWSPPPQPDPGPQFTLDVLVNGNSGEAIVSPGDTVTIDVTALKDGSTTTEFDGNTHRVPIFDVDGSKAALIKVTIQNGTASATFMPSEAGIYTVETSKIHPNVTQARIPNAPVVIAE